MKILLKGYYGFGNLGDDILLKVVYGIVKEKYPDAQIFIFSNFTENLREFDRGENYNKYIFKILGEEIELIDWTYKGYFDLLIDGGGGIYFDKFRGGISRWIINWTIKKLRPSSINKIENFIRSILLRQENIVCTCKEAWSIGVEPYNKYSIKFLRDYSQWGSYQKITVRDSKSFDYLRRFRLPNISMESDLAFNTEYWLPELNDLKKTRSKIADTKSFIGFVLSDQFSNLFQEISVVIDQLISQGNNILLFSFDANTDKGMIEFFKKYQLFIWNPHMTTFYDFMRIYYNCQIIFSTRFHGLILNDIFKIDSYSLDTHKLRSLEGELTDKVIYISKPSELLTIQNLDV